MDNGSLEPESTLQLRRIAAELDARLLCRVDPVSLAHSAKIPAEALNGRPAELFEAAVDRGWREGVNDFLVLPLFVGPSHAITRHVPALLAERKKKSSAFRSVWLRRCLYLARCGWPRSSWTISANKSSRMNSRAWR